MTGSGITEIADRYEMLGDLGDGGMGMVYKAKDRETGAIVALKMLRPELANDPQIAERFRNELLLARKITHKNVCRIHEFGRAGDAAYISMEYVEGETLRDLMKRRGALPSAEAVEIVQQLCAGLGEAHEQGVVHRDLKPENVMVDVHGHVKVMDFGIARSMDTRTNLTVGWIGTPAYMSPEQASGSSTTVRSDVYAVGLILYELLTGQATFSADTPVAVALKHMQERPQAPRSIAAGIPADIERVILRCLEKDPAARYASAREVGLALGGSPVPAAASTRRAWLRPSRGILIGAVVVIAIALGLIARPHRVAQLRLPISEHTLPNGLHIVLSEDHSAPTIGVSMVYKVGSRDETPGHSGMAHLFEHLMFQGSENVAKAGHSALIPSVGGLANAGTTPDQTQFYENVPANQLTLALFLESDRLRSLRVDEVNLDNARKVVSEERRMSGSNRPYGRTGEAMLSLAYDAFPYQHMVVGTSEDVDAITPEQARAFHDKYYVPSNVILTIVGDFREDSAVAIVHRYFDAIPKRPVPARAAVVQLPRTRERRQVVEDAFAPATYIVVSYLTPGNNGADQPALELAASILGAGESARLNQSLVRGAEVASQVGASVENRMGPSMFTVGVVLRQGKTVDQAQQLLDSGITRLQREPVTPQELTKAKLQARRTLSTSFEATTTRAVTLGTGAAMYGGASTVNDIAPATQRVTSDDIQRVALKYLVPTNRAVVVTVPSARRVAAAPPVAERLIPTPALDVRAEAPRVPAPIASALPSVHMVRPVQFTLSNGLTAIVVENHRLPQVYVNVAVLGAGPLYDPAGTPGLAALASDMLRDGTTTRTGRQIADQIEETGAVISTSAANGSVAATVLALGLSDNFEGWLPILADMIQNPRFPADELNGRRRRMIAAVGQQHSTPRYLAEEQMAMAVYGSHPASRLAPSVEALGRMDAAMVKQWHREHFAPQNTVVSIVGDVDAGNVRKLLEQQFGQWPHTSFTPAVPANPTQPAAQSLVLVDRPGSSQSMLMVGGLAIDRRSPDYPAMLVLNRVLGGEASVARLGFLLRETKGYAYDAQSTFTASTYPGAWRAWAEVGTGVTKAALGDLLAEVRRMSSEPVPAEELERAKRSLVASFAVSLEQSSQVLSYWMQAKRYDFSDDYWDTYPEKIAAVTADEVQQVARKYYDPSRFQVVVVGDGAVAAPILSKLGPVTRVGSPK